MAPLMNIHHPTLLAAIACFLLAPLQAQAGAFVIPHIVEKQGDAASTTYTLDTFLYFVYPGGQANIPDGGGATVDLFLYNADGSVMRSGTSTAVCNPCSYTVNASARKRVVKLEDLIIAAGGFGAQTVLTGYAVILVSGSDPDLVSISGLLENAHTSLLDAEFLPLDVQPVVFVDSIFLDGFEMLV